MDKNNSINDTKIEVDASAFVDSNAQIGSGVKIEQGAIIGPDVIIESCLLYTSPSPRD